MSLGNTARIRNASKSSGPTRLALPACALLALATVTFACGGEDVKDAGGSPTLNAPGVLATVALPPVPPDSADKAGLLVYRDTVAGQIFALNLSIGERLPVPSLGPAVASSMTALDCTRDGRLIAYANSVGTERVSIVSFAGEGTRPQSVEVPGSIVGMAWAPGADRIAMSVADGVGYRLVILDVNSGTTTDLPPVAGIPGAPRWSPDGQRLAFDINYNGLSDIHVLELGGDATGPVKVSSRPSAFTPDWSPDGSALVFSAADDQGGSPQIYAVDANGQNERKLTASNTQKWSPRWSLDGSLISYAGLVLVPAVSVLPDLSHNVAIWVAGADGTNETPVTDLSLDAQPLAWCLRGAWLP
jgi:Tol biopolymer transport system component